jgi:hypothetical protein
MIQVIGDCAALRIVNKEYDPARGDPTHRFISKKAPVHMDVSRVKEPRLKSALEMV